MARVTYQRAVAACTGTASSAASRNRQSSRAMAPRVSTMVSSECPSAGSALRTASAMRETSAVTRAVRSPAPAFSTRSSGRARARSTKRSRSRARVVSPSRAICDSPKPAVTPWATATATNRAAVTVMASAEPRSAARSTIRPSRGCTSRPTAVEATITVKADSAGRRCGRSSSATAARVRAGVATGSSSGPVRSPPRPTARTLVTPSDRSAMSEPPSDRSVMSEPPYGSRRTRGRGARGRRSR